MFRMYYISTAIPGLTANDHEEILQKARKNNAALDVTGLLVVRGNQFAQALEGEREKVISLFEKIKLDKRHLRIVIISQEEVEARIFPQWEMGFYDIAPHEELSEIDLNDPKFVSCPSELDRCFRRIIEMEIPSEASEGYSGTPTFEELSRA